MSASGPVELSSRGRPRFGPIPVFVYGALVALCVGVVWEGAIALGAFQPGPLPGQMPSGDDVLGGSASVALLAGGVVFAAASFSARISLRFAAVRGLRFVGVAAAAYVAASFFSYDPYYAPGLHRFSDGRLFLAPWVAALGILAVIVAVWAPRSRGAATLATAALMWLSLLALAATFMGH